MIDSLIHESWYMSCWWGQRFCYDYPLNCKQNTLKTMRIAILDKFLKEMNRISLINVSFLLIFSFRKKLNSIHFYSIFKNLLSNNQKLLENLIKNNIKLHSFFKPKKFDEILDQKHWIRLICCWRRQSPDV